MREISIGARLQNLRTPSRNRQSNKLSQSLKTGTHSYSALENDQAQVVAEAGSDYCDLSCEVPFIRAMIDRHHSRAQTTGARIVHCCGFDSIPSDLGTLMLQAASTARSGRALDRVTFVLGVSRGGFSGGTAASLTNVIESATKDSAVRRIVTDPYALNPETQRAGPDGPDLAAPRFNRYIGRWTGPFVMASINTRIVRRSNALFGWRYGRDFRSSEVTGFPPGFTVRFGAGLMAGGLGASVGALSWGPTRSLLRKTLLPSPGEARVGRSVRGAFQNQSVRPRHE